MNGVFGRRAGTLSDFEFSYAMTAAGRAGLIWTEQTLDTFITNSDRLVPGINMAPVRLPNPADRSDLIAYLKRAGE